MIHSIQVTSIMDKSELDCVTDVKCHYKAKNVYFVDLLLFFCENSYNPIK